MSNMRNLTLLLLLFAVCVSSAYRSGPVTITPFEYKDFGNASLPKFNDMEIIIDCNAANITTRVESSGASVAGASGYLTYVDYYVPLLDSGQTDSNGDVTFQIPSGNISHMTGIFVLTVEKSGYQRREAHFDIGDCFINAPASPPPSTTPSTPQQNATPPSTPPSQPPANVSQNASQQSQNASALGGTGNATGNGTLGTGNQTNTGTGNRLPFCPLGAVLLLAIPLFAMIFGERHAH